MRLAVLDYPGPCQALPGATRPLYSRRVQARLGLPEGDTAPPLQPPFPEAQPPPPAVRTLPSPPMDRAKTRPPPTPGARPRRCPCPTPASTTSCATGSRRGKTGKLSRSDGRRRDKKHCIASARRNGSTYHVLFLSPRSQEGAEGKARRREGEHGREGQGRGEKGGEEEEEEVDRNTRWRGEV